MSLFALIVVLAVLCVAFYLLKMYIVPMLPKPFGMIVMVVFFLIVILWLLSLIGVVPFGDMRIH